MSGFFRSQALFGSRSVMLGVALVCSVGCADKLQLRNDRAPAVTNSEPVATVSTKDRDGGGYITRVDASDGDTWIYFSFRTGEQVAGPPEPAVQPDAGLLVADAAVADSGVGDAGVTDAAVGDAAVADSGAGNAAVGDSGVAASDAGASLPWDLAFQRFHIRTPQGAAVALLAEQEFEELKKAPEMGYLEESDFDETALDLPFEAGDGWYSYSDTVLTPRDITYVVKLADGSHHKLQVLNYYSDSGESAHLQFAWSQLDAP